MFVCVFCIVFDGPRLASGVHGEYYTVRGRSVCQTDQASDTVSAGRARRGGVFRITILASPTILYGLVATRYRVFAD